MSGTALLSRMIEEEVGTTPLFFEEYQWIGRRRGAADGPFSQEKYSSGLNYIPIVNNEERDSGGTLMEYVHLVVELTIGFAALFLMTKILGKPNLPKLRRLILFPL